MSAHIRVVCPMCRKEESGNRSVVLRLTYTEGECPVCMEVKEPLVSLPCGHLFCKDDIETIIQNPAQRNNETEISLLRWFPRADDFNIWPEIFCNVGSDLGGFEAFMDQNLGQFGDLTGTLTPLQCLLTSVGPAPSFALVEKVYNADPHQVKAKDLMLFLDMQHATYGPYVTAEREVDANYNREDTLRIVQLLARAKPESCLTIDAIGADDAPRDVPLGYAGNKEEVQFLARFCPDAIRLVLFNLCNGGRKYGGHNCSGKVVFPEVIHEAFYYERTHPAQPKLLCGKSQFWLERGGLDDVANVPLTEDDEDGKTLLECMLLDHYRFDKDVYYLIINLLIQCMYSLFLDESEVSETRNPFECLEQMVRKKWLPKEVLIQYKNFFGMPMNEDTTQNKRPRKSGA